MIGHDLAAAGAIEAIVCALTIEQGIIHPTINLESPDPECDLDYVPNQARQAEVNIALSNSFGLGATKNTSSSERVSVSGPAWAGWRYWDWAWSSRSPGPS